MVRKAKKTTSLKRSTLEDRTQVSLESYKSKGEYTFSYETERLKYTIEKTYIPDWIIQRKDGSKLYIETKGWFKSADRTKMLKVKEAHPALDIRIVFERDNTLSKQSKTTYSQWATKHNFLWAIEKIPTKWLLSKSS